MPDTPPSVVQDDTSHNDPYVPWIKKLIAFESVSRNSNLDLIDAVRAEFEAFGISPILTTDSSGRKANLFATVPACNGAISGGIVLSGHTDVVPVDGQNWLSDPFQAHIRDGRLYGRGACDMKGFIGIALALLPVMTATRLLQPIHFALSFDEEVCCAGAPLMLAELQRRGVNPQGCIVGEPTSMQPVIAHKGINAYRCHVTGLAAHSSLTPKGSNAIEHAARVICHIRDLALEQRAKGPFDALYDIPYTTAQTSMISGGIAINTVPEECSFDFEFRNLPSIAPESFLARIERYAIEVVLPAMQREFAQAQISFTHLASAPGLDEAEGSAITQWVRRLTGDSVKRKVAYGTEAGLFAQAGIPSVVCGPGNIEQAHKANEYVELSQLQACDVFLRKLISDIST